jgi:hypothetical protein
VRTRTSATDVDEGEGEEVGVGVEGVATAAEDPCACAFDGVREIEGNLSRSRAWCEGGGRRWVEKVEGGHSHLGRGRNGRWANLLII